MTESRQRSRRLWRRTPELAKRLRRALADRGMTQRELAIAAGISPQYVSDLLLGKRGHRLSASIAAQLEDALGVERGFLVLRESVKTDARSVGMSKR